jgi:hypothetical protein
VTDQKLPGLPSVAEEIELVNSRVRVQYSRRAMCHRGPLLP